MTFAVKGRDKYPSTRFPITKVSIILEMAMKKQQKRIEPVPFFSADEIRRACRFARGGRVNGDAIPVVKNGTGAGCKKKGKKRKEKGKRGKKQEKRGRETREGKRGKKRDKRREGKKRDKGREGKQKEKERESKKKREKRFVSFCVSLGYSYLCRQDEAVCRFVYRL